MKIQVMPQAMVNQIGICQRAISSRTTMPILECIRFEAKGDQLKLTATDLELFIESQMPCRILEEGVVVIPATMIGNIFRKLPQEVVTLTEQEGRVQIDCGAVHFDIQVPNPEDFPPMPQPEEAGETVLDNDLLIQAIRETEFATSMDETRIELTGIFYERKKDQLSLVSLDGYRMAVRKIALAADAPEKASSAIVPKRAFNELSRILKEDEKTAIALAPGHIHFTSGSVRMVARLIDKKYIQYEDIISTHFSSEIILDRQDFQAALERASLLAKEERANLIKLLFQAEGLLIQSNSEIGSVQEKLGAKIDGEEMTIAFNAKYLLDGIKALHCDRVLLRLNGPLNPMVIHPEGEVDSYLYLVLPVRIAQE